MYRKSVFVVLIALFSLFLFAGVLAAQDETPVPTIEATLTPEPTVVVDVTPPPPAEPSPLPVLPVGDAADALLTTILVTILGTAISSPFVTFVVSQLKQIKLLNDIPSARLAAYVAAFAVVITWLATQFGFDAQLNKVLQLILVVGPPIMQFVGSLVGSGVIYNFARSHNIAVVGAGRPQKLDSANYPVWQPPVDLAKPQGTHGEGLRGQGLVEYALILVLVAVVVIVILALLGPAIGNVFSNIVYQLENPGAVPPTG